MLSLEVRQIIEAWVPALMQAFNLDEDTSNGPKRIDAMLIAKRWEDCGDNKYLNICEYL
jgi:hypothetical protein